MSIFQPDIQDTAVELALGLGYLWSANVHADIPRRHKYDPSFENSVTRRVFINDAAKIVERIVGGDWDCFEWMDVTDHIAGNLFKLFTGQTTLSVYDICLLALLSDRKAAKEIL